MKGRVEPQNPFECEHVFPHVNFTKSVYCRWSKSVAFASVCMQCDFVFITAGKCCINWCVALHRPGGGVSLSLTLSRPDQLLSISQYMKMYVYGKINFYNIGPRVCRCCLALVLRHSISLYVVCLRMHVCAIGMADTFQNARAQKALCRK